MLPESIRVITMIKVLDLLQTEISILLDYIGDLIHLDWLDHSQTNVSTLSDSTGVAKVLSLVRL